MVELDKVQQYLMNLDIKSINTPHQQSTKFWDYKYSNEKKPTNKYNEYH